MRLEPPSWWYSGRIPVAAWGLLPISAIYGELVERRFRKASPYRSTLPVLCVGNFTMGGAGKTPVALKLAYLLRDSGYSPAFLSRGYGGQARGPHIVDRLADDAASVGDEPLLLARAAPTVVSRNRPLGAQLLQTLAVDAIIMDDGFQNPSLQKDFSLVVVDAGSGVGSSLVFPLGPLRARLAFQAAKADAILILGGYGNGGNATSSIRESLQAVLENFTTSRGGKKSLAQKVPPILEAQTIPLVRDELLNRPFLAFCGIGRPAKFFDTLCQAGITVVKSRTFPDHHSYTEADALCLLEEAKALKAGLVTTEKDHVRVTEKSGALGELYESAIPLPITIEFSGDYESRLMMPIAKALTGR
jgi:tetraacyldisaccharide 4'-kinase